ncbi:Protein kinase superfamily protein, partial [Prunus dulcis]
IEEEREGRSKVEGSRSEYSPVRLFAQTFGAFIESTSYTQRVLKESVPPIFQSTEAFQTTMVGSKRTRSKTAAMAQSVTAQSYSSHDPTIDMAAPPPLAAMNPQQPPCVTETTVPPAGLAHHRRLWPNLGATSTTPSITSTLDACSHVHIQ